MGELLFCPFCREPFEGIRCCPEHELQLVPFFELPRAARERDPEAPLPWYSPALGRGPVVVCAALTLVAFLTLPLAVVADASPMGGSMLRLARESSPRLWLVPAAAIAMLMVVARRRTPVGLRGLRVLVPLLACVAPAVVLWVYGGVIDAVELLRERRGAPLTAQLASGAYVVFAAALPAVLFGLRLGVSRGDAQSSGRKM